MFAWDSGDICHRRDTSRPHAHAHLWQLFLIAYMCVRVSMLPCQNVCVVYVLILWREEIFTTSSNILHLLHVSGTDMNVMSIFAAQIDFVKYLSKDFDKYILSVLLYPTHTHTHIWDTNMNFLPCERVYTLFRSCLLSICVYIYVMRISLLDEYFVNIKKAKLLMVFLWRWWRPSKWCWQVLCCISFFFWYRKRKQEVLSYFWIVLCVIQGKIEHWLIHYLNFTNTITKNK